MTYLWIVLMVLLIILEASTVQLVSIWFAIGALGALLVSLLSPGSTVIQIAVFVIVSLIALVVTRPLVKKFTKAKIQPTNADRFVGADAVVTEEINNSLGTGLVNSKGTIWTARSVDGEIIPVNTSVTVDRIEGVKLIVHTK